MKPSALVQKIGTGIIYGVVFLWPLFFLPTTSDFYDFNKQILLFGSSLVLFICLSIYWVLEKQVRILRSPLGLPSLALAVSLLLSTIIKSPNKIEALLDPAQAGTYLAAIVLFFAVINLIHTKKEFIYLVISWLASSFVLGLMGIFWATGLANKVLPASLSFAKSLVWTPTGNALSTIIYLGVAVVFAVFILIKAKPTTKPGLLSAGLIFVSLISMGLFGYLLFSPKSTFRPSLMPQSTGWTIALEVLKTSPIFGSGPGSYLTDFTQYRPINFNLTPNWALRFTSSSNQFLQMLTLGGFLGLAAFLLWVVKAGRMIAKSFSAQETYSLATSAGLVFLFVTSLVLPLSNVTLGLMFILAAVLVLAHKHAGFPQTHEASLDIIAASGSGQSPILPWAILVLSVALGLPSFYLLGRAYVGEMQFQQSLVAAAANDGKKTYDTLIETIKTNPYRDAYRVAYSQTNMLIANSIANTKNISEADRGTITQLIQQALREAKNAIALNPTKVTNVENLALIYRNLLNFVQEADAWTIASYRQAIVLDPINPNLRISLGGVFFAQKNYDEAIRFFQTAVDLKPDLANAHYNLAAAYREKGQYENALASMERVLQLVDRNSDDFTKASSEADELRKKITPAAEVKKPAAPSQLKAPESSLPTPKINPPLTVPANLAPEAPVATPTPAPTPTQ